MKSSVNLISYHAVITNDILKKALRFSGKVAVLASEEEDSPIAIKTNMEKYDEKDGYVDAFGDIGIKTLKTTSFSSDVSTSFVIFRGLTGFNLRCS